jgi:integrase
MPLLQEARKIATCPYVIERGSKPVSSVKTGTRAAARRAGLHCVKPHVLRHIGATWVAIAGVPVDQIGRLLGHTNPRLMLRVYAKHSPDYLKSAIEALSGSPSAAPMPMH